MRVLLILLLLAAVGLYAGFRLRKQDRMSSGILFVFATAMILAWMGAFFGWFGGG